MSGKKRRYSDKDAVLAAVHKDTKDTRTTPLRRLHTRSDVF